MSLAAYLQRNNVERILLCEITQGNTTFYISDHQYDTEFSDSIGAIPYTPIIGEGGLPAYSTSLADILSVRASSSTGILSLADEWAMSTVSGTDPDYRRIRDVLKRGATMVFKLTAPRNLFPYADAITLFTTTLRSIGGDDEGGLQIETNTVARVLFEAQTPTRRGVYGRVFNIPLELTSFADQEYDTHPGGPILGVNSVYDNTVTLFDPAGYSVNTATGKVTLVNNPAGLVTGDVDGFVLSGTWLESIEDIGGYLAAPYVSSSVFETPADRIGYFHRDVEFIADILDKLAESAAAFWFIDDNNVLRMKLWNLPGAPVTTYTKTEMLRYSFEMNSSIHNSQDVRYMRNWTVQTAIDGATAAHADFIANDGPVTTQTNAGDGSDATVAPLIESYFENQAPADAVATRVTSILASKRDIYRTEVPLVVAHTLGDSIEIETNEGFVTGFLMGRTLKFDGGVPTQELTLYV